MRILLLALVAALPFLGNGPASAQGTQATLDNHESRITDLESDVTDLDARVTALENTGSGDGQDGPLAFIGYSSGTTLGDQGVTGLTAVCSTDFPGARVCTTKEFMLSANIEQPDSDAWILPEFVAATDSNCIDYSGRNNSCNLLNCGQWTNPGVTGLTVQSATGGIFEVSCTTSRPVACCAPPQ